MNDSSSPEPAQDGRPPGADPAAPAKHEERAGDGGHGSNGQKSGEPGQRNDPEALEPPDRHLDPAGGRGDPAAGEGGHTGTTMPELDAEEDFDDDDLEELNEQVDLDELDDLPDVPGLSPVPMGIKTAEAKAAGDEPIPMLTEVVQVPRYDSEDLPQSFAEVDWGGLGQRVRENVLERLLRRSDALLDAQLQDTLTPVLERAAETVAHELHDALNRMIRDIVARAVTEELTRLHAEIAKRNRASRPT